MEGLRERDTLIVGEDRKMKRDVDARKPIHQLVIGRTLVKEGCGGVKALRLIVHDNERQDNFDQRFRMLEVIDLLTEENARPVPSHDTESLSDDR